MGMDRVFLWNPDEDQTFDSDIEVYDADAQGVVGKVRLDVLNNNVVITVERIDESKFGPVSVVVV